MNLNLIESWIARRFFRQYLRTLRDYRASRDKDHKSEPPPGHRGVFVRGREGDASQHLRAELCQMAAEAKDLSDRLEVSPLIRLKPNLRTGAGQMTLNVFDCAVDPGGLHTPLYWQEIIDVVQKCIGASDTVWNRRRWAVINPIDWLAFLVRIPFVVLRRAGLPAQIEENVWAHVIKAGIAIALLMILGWLGFEPAIRDIVSLLRGR